MTTSRRAILCVLLGWVAWTAEAQTWPKDLPWAVSEFVGEGDWAVRLPQLVVRGWQTLPDHKLSPEEKLSLVDGWVTDSLLSLDQQTSRAVLSLDEKRLAGVLPETEPAATQKMLVELDKKRVEVQKGPSVQPPDTLGFRPVWPSGQEGLPWPTAPREELLAKTKASYLITGSVKVVGPSLGVRVELFSQLERRTLAEWEGQFAPDEAQDAMSRAAASFRTLLLGRPWAGLDVTSPVEAQILVNGRWHHLPWSSDDLEPATIELKVRYPGRPEETRTVVLESEKHLSLALEAPAEAPDTLVLETDPPGAFLYLDSRYLGPSPQAIPRPFVTVRVRAESLGWADTAWEVGPRTASPSRKVLTLPEEPASIPDAKDRFYTSLAVFSFSLTSTAFIGAWRDEQVKLTNAYAKAGARAGYETARSRFNVLAVGYAGSIVLTSGVFVWMMGELWDYLGTAQRSLP